MVSRVAASASSLDDVSFQLSETRRQATLNRPPMSALL
jgi:hypothetical protein